MTRPPIAEKPNWPSESCPAHPLRIVSEQPAIAKISTRVQRNDCDAWVANTGMIVRTTRTAATPKRGSWRTAQVPRTRSGSGFVRPASFHDGSESAAARAVGASVSTTTSVATNSQSANTFASAPVTFCWKITSTMPSAMPTGTVSHRIRMRAIMAMRSAFTSTG